jgi:hypothetical protein
MPPPILANDVLRKCGNPSCAKASNLKNGSLARCSACRVIAYCSGECQRGHWKLHKTVGTRCTVSWAHAVICNCGSERPSTRSWFATSWSSPCTLLQAARLRSASRPSSNSSPKVHVIGTCRAVPRQHVSAKCPSSRASTRMVLMARLDRLASRAGGSARKRRDPPARLDTTTVLHYTNGPRLRTKARIPPQTTPFPLCTSPG